MIATLWETMPIIHRQVGCGFIFSVAGMHLLRHEMGSIASLAQMFDFGSGAGWCKLACSSREELADLIVTTSSHRDCNPPGSR